MDGFGWSSGGRVMIGPLGYAGIGVAAGAGEGLMNYFGGGQERKLTDLEIASRKQKMGFREKGFNLIHLMLNNPQFRMAMIKKGIAPQVNQVAGNASRRLGLDSGAAQGEIARYNASMLAKILAGQDMNLMQIMSNYA
jgi:hypothetical protein